MVRYCGKGLTALNVVKKINPKWKDPKSLLYYTSEYPRLRQGSLVTEKKYDRWTRPKEKSPRHWRELAASQMEVPKQVEFSTFDNTNCHELDGRFRFNIYGRFLDGGVRFSFALKRVADDLHLVGWCRIRGHGGEGALEGDVYGLDDVKQWLKSRVADDHKTSIRYVSFTDETNGLSLLKYPDFTIAFDRRKVLKLEHARKKVAQKNAALKYLTDCQRHSKERQVHLETNFYSRS